MEFLTLSPILGSIVFVLPRILAAFTVLPFLGKSMLGGRLMRNGVAFSFALLLIPVVVYQHQQHSPELLEAMVLILKEIFLGLIIGYLAAVPFWAIESMGFIIDNQRGASMASSMNPLSGSQSSPLGILLVQVFVTLFFVGGSFVLFLGALYKSYAVWPIFAFLPPLSASGAFHFIQQLDYIFRFTVLYAAPILISMFLAELGLALISRFAPQLNVFFLAMPVKSAVAIFILVIYITTLSEHVKEHIDFGNTLIHTIASLFETPQS